MVRIQNSVIKWTEFGATRSVGVDIFLDFRAKGLLVDKIKARRNTLRTTKLRFARGRHTQGADVC